MCRKQQKTEMQEYKEKLFLKRCGYEVFYHCKQPSEITKTASIVFLHHATGSSLDWRDQMTYFSQQGYKCIAYDRFGFGRSIPDDDKFSGSKDSFQREIMAKHPFDYYDRYLEELAELIRGLDLQSVILVGHSDGATISLLAASGQHSAMASDFRTSEESLSLLHKRVIAVVVESPHMSYDNSKEGFESFSGIGFTKKFWASTARDQLSMENAKKVVDRWLNLWFHTADWRVWNEKPSLAHIKCPVLIIHGEVDIFWPVTHSQLIAELIRNNPHTTATVEFHLFEQVGHTAHREVIQAYNSRVLQFMEKHRHFLTSKL